MRIAIVGTRPPVRRGQIHPRSAAYYEREVADYQLITRDVLRVLAARLARGRFTIVTGGAKGVDSLAEHFARVQGLPCLVVEPDYPRWPPKTAPVVRNGVIACEADAMVAWPSRRGGGTANAIEWAETWGIPVVVRRPWATKLPTRHYSGRLERKTEDLSDAELVRRNRVERDHRDAEQRRLASMAPTSGTPARPGRRPPLEHDPLAPDCGCDRCDPPENLRE